MSYESFTYFFFFVFNDNEFSDTYKLQLTLNNLQQLESNAHAMLLAFRVLSCSAPLYSEWHLRYKCDKKKVA